MSSASPSFTLPSANDVLLAPPSTGPAVCTPSLRSHVIALPARSVLPDRSLRLSSEAPTVQSFQLNPEIEILPQLSGSLVAPTTTPLTCASSLTERALRSQPRDALRALHDVAVPSQSPIYLHETTSDFGAQTEYSPMQPSTPRQTTPIHNYSNSVHNYSNSVPARRATMHVADHPPFTVRVIPPRVFTPLTPLRASSNTMPSTTTSATSSPQKTTTASPAHTAPLPLLDSSPTPSPDLRANTGSRTGRTPGLRPTAPVPRAALTANGGPPPHLDHWAHIWDTRSAQQRADLARPSIHEVEKGLARTHVAASAASDPDRHAIDLGTAEHDRVAAPLLSRLSVLRGHRATADTALLECQARVTAIDTQERSTAAAFSAEKRRHASFLSGFSDPTPASATTVTFVAPPVPQPAAVGASMAPTAAAATRSPASTAPTAAAATRSSASTAPVHTGFLAPPVGTLQARHSMQPPAPRESRDSSDPPLWSVVARRPPQQDNRPAPRTARYLELPVSKFMFRNSAFPSDLRIPIKDHATEVHETLFDLTGKRYRLDRALALATKTNTPLSEQVVNATLRLRDLLDAACGTLSGEHWLLDTLRAFETARANRSGSSASDSSAPTGQRRREEPSSGRGNAKRATFSGSDSDSAPHPRRTERDRRQVPPVIFHAAESDSDTPSFPPKIFRPRVTQRLPSRAPISSTVHDLSSTVRGSDAAPSRAPIPSTVHDLSSTVRGSDAAPSRVPISSTVHDLPSTVHGSDAASAPSLKRMVEAVTAAAIAAVDRHLERLGLCIAPTVPHTDSAAASHTVSPVERTTAVAPYTAPVTHPAMTPPGTVLPSAASHTSVAPRTVPPLARSAPVIPYTGPNSVPHPPYTAMTSPNTVHPFTSYGSLAQPPPPVGTVYQPNYAAMASHNTVPSLARPASVAPPPPSLGTVNPYIYTTANPAPVPTLPPPPCPTAPAERDATPPDERFLNDDCSSLTSNSSNPSRLRADFVASLQAAYRTLDMRRVPRVQPLQFLPSADRTAATHLLIRSMRDALSGIFDVADPTGTVTMDSPVWVSGWNAPLLKHTKAAINANRDDTHDLHRLVDDLFSQLQEKLSSGIGGPAAFKTLLTDFADYFDRAPRGAALATLQNFGVRTGTPFASYLRALRVVVASTVEKGGPLAPSSAMAIELVRIRTAQQYPMLMPTLFPGDLATREKPYVTLASMWTAFNDLKHNMSPAIDGDTFASAARASGSHAPPTVAVPAASTAVLQRHYGRPPRPSHSVSNISHTHSRRDPFRVDYGLWPFDDKDYDIVCTVTNQMINTNMSLWTPLLTADARRQACIQHSGRCCNCGSTEHSLRWCPSPFANVFSLLNPEFATHDKDGSLFESWKESMRQWRRRNPNRKHQGNGRRNASGYNNSRSHYQSNGNPHYQGNSNGPPLRTHFASAAPQLQAPSSAPGPPPALTAAPLMRYGPTATGNTNPNTRRPGTFQVPPTTTP